MRGIKFRLWDKDYNYMIEPEDIHPRVTSECITGDGKVLEVIENNSYMGTDISFEDIYNNRILMQYTGLKDKNGKEIYEGDVVKVSEEYGGHAYSPLVVDFKDSCFVLRRINYMSDYNPMFKYDFTQVYEIIGNIYENPELLSE